MPYYVYVIRLRSEVLTKKKKFAKANPGHIRYKPCVYVGQSGNTPEVRYQKHLTAKSGSKLVKEFHVSLHKKLTEKQPIFETREESIAHEFALTERLRKKGYAAWCR